jgi:anion-transporting  ArsA/GET3 family ATPase
VCVGSGGVGKTTTAASLALAGARAGRKTLVLTIDPAKRLATALGLDALDFVERPVPNDRIGGVTGSGSLHAMMLDQKHAFDDLVRRYVRDPAAVARIHANRIYQQIATTLAGSHEYAAMARLHELAEQARYDLIVLDTPPTSNALDFLDAPERMSAAVDSPLLQWLVKHREGGRFSLKSLGMGATFILKRLARFVGSEFFADVAEFLGEFQDIIGGFREQSKRVYDILRDDGVAFVLVASPEALAIDEALYFHERLAKAGMPVGAFVINRVHPPGPEAPARDQLIDQLGKRRETAPLSADQRVQLASDLDRTYRELQQQATNDAQEIARLTERAGVGVTIAKVPLLDDDVVDVRGLEQLVSYLTAG